MSRRRYTTRFIAWLNTQWKSRAIRFSIILGSGMGVALGIFSLKPVTISDSDAKAVVGHLLSRVFEGLGWLTLELPVKIITFLLCRPKYDYSCVDGLGMIYALFIGMPMLLVLWVVLSGFLGAVMGGLAGFLFNEFSCRMRR